MIGSSLVPIVVPIVVTIALGLWLGIVFHVADHPEWGVTRGADAACDRS
jgi:hypothetical protein